jgi:hypothetical protein
MRVVLLAVLVTACGPAPRCVTPAPSLPRLRVETWRCSAGATSVVVTAGPELPAVEVDGAPARCALVLLP